METVKDKSCPHAHPFVALNDGFRVKIECRDCGQGLSDVASFVDHGTDEEELRDWIARRGLAKEGDDA